MTEHRDFLGSVIHDGDLVIATYNGMGFKIATITSQSPKKVRIHITIEAYPDGTTVFPGQVIVLNASHGIIADAMQYGTDFAMEQIRILAAQ